MSQIKNRITLNLILIFSVFALGAAYFIQHILGHKPCNLCLIERLPYIFAIIMSIINPKRTILWLFAIPPVALIYRILKKITKYYFRG